MGCGAVKVGPAEEDHCNEYAQVLPAETGNVGENSAVASAKKETPEQQEPENEPAVLPQLAATGSCGGGGAISLNVAAVKSDSKMDDPWIRSPRQRKRVNAHREAEGEESSVSSPETHTKNDISPENRRFLNKVLQKHFLFSALEDEERNSVIDFMVMQPAQTGETIFKQDQAGDSSFIIQSGTFTVAIDQRVFKQLRSKHTFGELAMLYNVKRTATVACAQAGTLWRLSERYFRQCMDSLRDKHLTKVRGFLDSDPTFGVLAEKERDVLASVCTVQTFLKGEQILREGEVGDWMFIIIDGIVSTVDQFGNAAMKQPGFILGSTGLMYMKRQIHGAKAHSSQVTCLALGKSSLERLIGPVENVLRRSAIQSLILDNVAGTGDLECFRQLTDQQQKKTIDNFEEVTFLDGEVIISKGSCAQFIILIEGEAAVVSDATQIEGGGFNIRDYCKQVISAGSYGSKNLVTNAPMEDCVVALGTVRLHRVGYDTLLKALGEPLSELARLNEIKKVLQDIFLFKNLAADQLELTTRALVKQRYAANEVVVKQGDDASHFFLIQAGIITVLKDGQKLRTLGRWDYFGERGLLLEEKRSATCQAESMCICLLLDTTVFRDIVGKFRRELENRMYLQDLDLTMADLRAKAIVGRGTFGIVKLVYHYADESKVYALKCVKKQQVMRQNQQKSIVVERDINAQCYHPCIMQFIKTFQDAQHVYFLTEFLGGGDLFFAIREIGNLSKEHSQFFGASIVLALEYLHGRGIMYRDLKPENVLLDFDGNAKLVDFGCCKKGMRTATLVGTPEYLAPEVVLGKGYTCSVDWWALGVMFHEFIVGPLPFGRDTEDQLELFREILEAPLQFPQYVTDETGIAIISGLLDRSPELRMGSSTRGAQEIREHRYYTGFDWNALAGHYMLAPWTPDTKRLKANWELCGGEPLGSAEDAWQDGKVEPGMSWAKNF